MSGKIYFEDLHQVAEFLKHFTGSTAIFTVKQEGAHRWVLEFDGGF